MKGEDTFRVKEYLRFRVADGVEQMLLSWIGFRKQTWEPLQSLFLREDDKQYMEAIRDKYREVRRKYEKKGVNVENLEIVNPHLKNAKELQRQLDLEYHYASLSSSGGSEEESSEKEEDRPNSIKAKPIRRTSLRGKKATMREKKITKREHRELIACQAGLTHFKQIEPSKQPSKEKGDEFSALRNTIRNSFRKPQLEKTEEASKVRLDFRARFREQSLEMLRRRAIDELKMGAEEQNSHQLINKLLQHAKVQRMFFKDENSKRETYYEMAFEDAQFPIIFHESYLLQCCSGRMVSFFMGH